MSLIKREPSPAQSRASQANSLRSTGPRSARGKAVSSRNLRKPRAFSQVVARSMEAIGESPGDFEQVHKVLVEAMEPRDGWEAAWVQDIAILRWRLERLQRAEVGVLAARRRRLQSQRRREASPPTGAAGLELKNLVGLLGFTGLPDSAMKFQQVMEFFNQLRDVVRAEMFDQDVTPYFTLLYGKTSGPQAVMLKARFETLAKSYKEGRSQAVEAERQSLLADLSKEISSYEQLQALYAAEHLEDDPVREDADLLLPSQELDEVIRYETHLEDQIERKLRQFYARRREPVLRRAETLPAASEEPAAGELACQTASVGA